jgi:type IX secretion system PorP/SprF family membrane protein
MQPKSKMKRIIFITIIALAAGKTFCQNPQFSQYYASPLLVAPSFAGNSLGTRAFLSYRDQWAKLAGSVVTYSAAVDNNFYTINSGMGVVVMRDVVGSARLGSTSITGMYSYRFNITDDWRIRPGISISYTQRSLQYKRAIFPDQISFTGTDPSSIEQPNDPYYYIDASSSIVVYNRRMWFGLCVDNMLRPNASMARLNARLPMQWSQFGGVNFPMHNSVGRVPEVITLNYLLKATTNYRQMDVGINWYRAPLLLGFAWRGIPAADGYHSYDALIFTAGIAFNNMAIGYSYDFTVSQLGSATGGSHEITLSIAFNEGNKKNRQGAIPCPDVVKFKMFGDKESFR